MVNETQKMYHEMMCLYGKLKHLVKTENRRLYEQWKAGGFIIDPDILSMYPCLEEVIEKITEDTEEEEEEDE